MMYGVGRFVGRGCSRYASCIHFTFVDEKIKKEIRKAREIEKKR